MKPRALDLFCGAGGATKGLQMAGFHVTGVDIKPQPRYIGDAFHQADAMTFPLDGYDLIWASPPCQAFTNARVIHGREHPDLLTPMRERLNATNVPWVIENVPGSPMRKDLILCGSMFPELRSENGALRRHGWFEFWEPRLVPTQPCSCSNHQSISVFGHGGDPYHGVADWKAVMGIDWMSKAELANAIPPAYAHHIGTYAMMALGVDLLEQEENEE